MFNVLPSRTLRKTKMCVVTPGLRVIFMVVKYFLLPFYDIHQKIVTGTSNSNYYGSQVNSSARVNYNDFIKNYKEDAQLNIQVDKLYSNPLLTTNTPDPAVLALPDNAGYVLVATSNYANSYNQNPAFPLFFSQDLVHWNLTDHVFPAGKWPSWAKSDMWAPEIHLVNNRFLVYFTAGDVHGRLHIGVALSTTDSPFGPYRDNGSPVVTEPGSLVGAIDAHYFKDPKSGDDFLLWKTDSVFGFQSSLIYIRQLNKDGVSFKEDSEAVSILCSDQAAERLTAEGPWLMFRDGVYFLFFSSGWFFEAKYHMRVARSNHLLGPYHKHARPVIETDWDRFNRGENCSFVGPGHGSVVVDGAGDWWMVYHSWRYGHVEREPGRLALMDRIQWEDGWPVIGIPSDTPRPAPRLGMQCAEGNNMEEVCQSGIK